MISTRPSVSMDLRLFATLAGAPLPGWTGSVLEKSWSDDVTRFGERCRVQSGGQLAAL